MSDKKSFIVNDESVNSYGFIMRNAGAKLERFNANPIMLDLHSRDNDKVLGRWENLRVEGSLMLADPVWDVEDEYAAKIKGKVDRGFIKGCSLGAVPLKTMYNEDDDMVEVVEWELKEISIASVPSNAGSLVLVDAKGQQLTREALIELSDKVHNNQFENKMKNLKLFAKAINLADTATEDEVLEGVQDLHNKNIELADANAALTKKVGKLEAENTKLKDAQKDTVKNMAIALVDGAIAGKKILAGERDEYIELAENNYDLTKKLLDKKQAYRSVAEQIENGGSGAGSDVKLSDEIKSMNWDAAFKAGKTEFIRLNDLDHFKTIFKAKFGKEYPGA